MSNNIEIQDVGDARIVRFTRPEIRSPLSIAVIAELEEIVDACREDGAISSLIFTGTANVFASGADLREIAEVTASTAAEFARRGQRLMGMIEDLPTFTVAAINGYCFGGALDLALACNRRIASPNARFAHPGTGLGIITGWGGTQRLPRLIGRTRALEMFFTAEAIDAQRALRFGLIDEIAESPLESALRCNGD